MITYLINQLALAGFNLINSRIDAYRILRNKSIAHGINLLGYSFFCTLLWWLRPESLLESSIFFISAFCNRQFSFDIPLNLRRGLKFDYVTKAKPAAAWLDRQEIRLFGYNGRAPLVMYAVVWVVCLIVKIFI